MSKVAVSKRDSKLRSGRELERAVSERARNEADALRSALGWQPISDAEIASLRDGFSWVGEPDREDRRTADAELVRLLRARAANVRGEPDPAADAAALLADEIDPGRDLAQKRGVTTLLGALLVEFGTAVIGPCWNRPPVIVDGKRVNEAGPTNRELALVAILAGYRSDAWRVPLLISKGIEKVVASVNVERKRLGVAQRTPK